MTEDSMQMGEFSRTIFNERYAQEVEGRKETLQEVGQRCANEVGKSVGMKKALRGEIARLITLRKFLPGGRYLAQTGKPYHQVNNCLMLRAEDSREGWAEIMHNASLALMTGAGIGVNYSHVRPEGKPIRKTGGTATGPLALMQMVNESARWIRQGGTRRAALWAGLNWKHADIHKFITLKNWVPEVRALKAKNVDFPAAMDITNISIGLDDEFFKAYNDEKHALNSLATSVYRTAVERMLKTGEPGFSIDTGINNGEDLRNACTELCSRDDSDICNLGSINMSRIDTLEEMREVTEIATAFLLAGTVYSDVPYAKVDQIRTKNRRLGLGLMGIHEWLLKRGKKYGQDDELAKYLEVYRDESNRASAQYAEQWELSKPLKCRAIAPTGTISILAETSGGIEPIFVSAYKRLYYKGNQRYYQYVVDPTAKKLIESGIEPDNIEDAYVLAETPERRVKFQAWVQKYVDHSVSSTVNLPHWGSEINNETKTIEFGDMLIKTLPSIRGITVYPDGARSAQPMQPVSYKTAIKHVGEVFIETSNICDITGGGTCGS
jgi:ribonucleoside-diphosphate reductase alpha chain